jgi:mannose-6-phosphate isomerase-like protein (cupin superfamily)
MSRSSSQPIIVDFDHIAPVPCPCGQAQRAFADTTAFPGTVHRTRISGTAERHYHNRLTETYYILDCEPGAQIELDGQLHPLKPGVCVVIPPGVRHRAMGTMTILNIVFPKFDPSDEVVE